MALTDRLRDFDQRILPGTREPDEDAETYLRRVASSRVISPAQAGDVMAALRVYFGVQSGAEDENDEGEDAKAQQDEPQTDEAEQDDAEKDDAEKDDEKDDDES
jgi:uncharacterized membrane protein YukC